MHKFLSALVDISSGLLFALIAFFSARVLLQSAPLVYLCFPLLVTAAVAVGFWRGAKGTLPLVLTAFLTDVPLLILALRFFSGRNKPFIVFPVVTFAFVCIGVAAARMRATPRVVTMVAVIGGIAGALAGPAFVRLIVPSGNVNERPRQFAITLANGATLSPQNLRGKVVVLDFWATWCVPCQHELPDIQRAYERVKGQKDVVFIAVDGVMTDVPGDTGDTLERAEAYFHRSHYTIPLAWDKDAALEKGFGLHGFPTLIIVDGDGRVRLRRVGYIGSEDIGKILLEKIAELHRMP